MTTEQQVQHLKELLNKAIKDDSEASKQFKKELNNVFMQGLIEQVKAGNPKELELYARLNGYKE